MTTVGGLVSEGGEVPRPTGPPTVSTGPPAPATPGIHGVGVAARENRAGALDAWLSGLFRQACAPDREDTAAAGLPPGVALFTLGGLGRRECAPHSDLDLVLLHTGAADVGGIAER